ncbi:NAD-dependent epimerase [Oxalicibacterium faecigallinarum]|uniref:NAD-dependent epimerase n=1 Tax=Oxalicibacterium faecigallinarum TaxID=573741 RepID=A0A8J3AQH7_9BURK|nr:NAD-dependent epimerase [Oxalicibacterium faecigallinarum]GGI17924.1 NAD-dependent epimerase [Oxalicibacterium faecigallinarum]
MKILVTGCAGFIGMHVTKRLLARGDIVVGIDNLNDYYDPQLKVARLAQLSHANFRFERMNIADRSAMSNLFDCEEFNRVVHLAAQAGVRYSLKNPHAYAESNLTGFVNVLEECRRQNVQHLVYASSSSVYGANTRMPFSVHNNVDHPLSIYAATKKSNELMAHSYSHLFNLPTTGLRFFTVYGPWGRPDMALFKFTKAILAGDNIQVFNYGKHRRDFTYIDDIVEGVIRVIDRPAQPNPDWSGEEPDAGSSLAPWKIYNIGNQQPIELMDYIHALEDALNKKAKLDLLPLQPGDVPDTYADVSDLVTQFDYRPTTPVKSGIAQYVEWYLSHYLAQKA